MAADNHAWFPLFEFQDWSYQSFLTLPTATETDAAPGSAVTGRKWASGEFACGQAFNAAGGYTLDGTLAFQPGVALQVSAHGVCGTDGGPATFEAVGTGVDGPMKGAVYSLVGWAFPGDIQSGAARVVNIRGSVRAVRGTDSRPDIEPGGMPLGTVGTFFLTGRPE